NRQSDEIQECSPPPPNSPLVQKNHQSDEIQECSPPSCRHHASNRRAPTSRCAAAPTQPPHPLPSSAIHEVGVDSAGHVVLKSQNTNQSTSRLPLAQKNHQSNEIQECPPPSRLESPPADLSMCRRHPPSTVHEVGVDLAVWKREKGKGETLDTEVLRYVHLAGGDQG
ncbi:hypothetical protein HDU87_007945, partial [Geranomyces variabilis]